MFFFEETTNVAYSIDDKKLRTDLLVDVAVESWRNHIGVLPHRPFFPPQLLFSATTTTIVHNPKIPHQDRSDSRQTIESQIHHCPI